MKPSEPQGLQEKNEGLDGTPGSASDPDPWRVEEGPSLHGCVSLSPPPTTPDSPLQGWPFGEQGSLRCDACGGKGGDIYTLAAIGSPVVFWPKADYAFTMGLLLRKVKMVLNRKISPLVAAICQASRPVVLKAITPNTHFSQIVS